MKNGRFKKGEKEGDSTVLHKGRGSRYMTGTGTKGR